MLLLDDVVAAHLGRARRQPVRDQPYWREVTSRVRHAHPDFVFLAEAYWDLEGPLLEQGFDLCYDKRLYDRLRDGDAASVRAHLLADPAGRPGSSASSRTTTSPARRAPSPPTGCARRAVALLTLPGRDAAARGPARRVAHTAPGPARPPPTRAARPTRCARSGRMRSPRSRASTFARATGACSR